MIRILHVVHTMECGGIETMLMNIYRKIDRSKIQFDFLVNGAKDSYYTDEIESLGGKIINVTPKRDSLKKNLKETSCVMKAGKYKIVHIHQDSMIAFAIYCAKKADINNIYVHAHTTSANGWYRKIIAEIARPYIRKNATEKFACSKAAANWIYGKKEKNYKLFKNAIDVGKLRYNQERYISNRKALGIDIDTFLIGTCGRFSIEKNQIFLVEVLKEIKEIKPTSKLLLVGDGEERAKILSKAKKLGVEFDLILPGMVSNTEFYYSIMDCFVLPSFFEGLPLVGIEAQAAGILSFFSTGVTKELKITPNSYFLDLDIGAKNWAGEILKHDCKRLDMVAEIKKAGYDINENILYLQNKYLSVV